MVGKKIFLRGSIYLYTITRYDEQFVAWKRDGVQEKRMYRDPFDQQVKCGNIEIIDP